MLKKIFIILYIMIINCYLCGAPVAQTLAHLRSIGNRDLDFTQNSEVINSLGAGVIAQYANLIRSMIEKEEQYFNDYYVFYHGYSNLAYTIQDVITEFYKLKNPAAILPRDFEAFVRVPNNKKFNEFNNINAFLDNQINTRTTVADYLSSVASFLLSVNLSLFANIKTPTESSFKIFIKNQGAKTLLDWQNTIIKEVLVNFGLDASATNINKIFNLSKLIPDKGALLQIFIPKNKVDSLAYLAGTYGKAYGSPYAQEIFFERTNKSARLPNFWKLLESDPKAALGDCKETIAKVLEAYTNLPNSNLKNFDSLQARILINNDYLLKPNSGIKIFRYNGYNNSNIADKQALDAYKKELGSTTKEIFGII